MDKVVCIKDFMDVNGDNLLEKGKAYFLYKNIHIPWYTNCLIHNLQKELIVTLTESQYNKLFITMAEFRQNQIEEVLKEDKYYINYLVDNCERLSEEEFKLCTEEQVKLHIKNLEWKVDKLLVMAINNMEFNLLNDEYKLKVILRSKETDQKLSINKLSWYRGYKINTILNE